MNQWKETFVKCKIFKFKRFISRCGKYHRISFTVWSPGNILEYLRTHCIINCVSGRLSFNFHISIMMLRFLLVSCFISSVAFSQSVPNLIEWQSAHRLSWEDFKGNPPADAKHAALTSSGILINFTYNDKSLSFDVTCNFDKIKSWVRVKNDHILAHEQGHFDITEIHARKLYRNLKAYRFRQASVSKDIHEIYQNVVNDLQLMQTEYDRETDHSRNFFQQKNWLVKIQNGLTFYKDYANYSK